MYFQVAKSAQMKHLKRLVQRWSRPLFSYHEYMGILDISGEPDRDAFHQLRDGPLYGTLVEMIKETIPELQKLSAG